MSLAKDHFLAKRLAGIFFGIMKNERKPSGLPDVQKVIEQARKLRELKQAGDRDIRIVVHPNGFHLNVDDPKQHQRSIPDENLNP